MTMGGLISRRTNDVDTWAPDIFTANANTQNMWLEDVFAGGKPLRRKLFTFLCSALIKRGNFSFGLSLLLSLLLCCFD